MNSSAHLVGMANSTHFLFDQVPSDGKVGISIPLSMLLKIPSVHIYLPPSWVLYFYEQFNNAGVYSLFHLIWIFTCEETQGFVIAKK